MPDHLVQPDIPVAQASPLSAPSAASRAHAVPDHLVKPNIPVAKASPLSSTPASSASRGGDVSSLSAEQSEEF